jgi:hypothetical protein
LCNPAILPLHYQSPPSRDQNPSDIQGIACKALWIYRDFDFIVKRLAYVYRAVHRHINREIEGSLNWSGFHWVTKLGAALGELVAINPLPLR